MPQIPQPRVRVGAVDVWSVREPGVAEHVARSWQRGEGGAIVTANVDIVRAATRRPELAALIAESEVVVADGMPVVWAGRLAGVPLPERVTGASLVFTLSGTAARLGRSVYLLGGDEGVPEKAAEALRARYPGLRVAGTDSPPFGFDTDPGATADAVAKVVAAEPDLVLVGLGFPKQERLIRLLRAQLPRTWFLGCGAGIPMAAGEFRRASGVVQRMGAEWLHRLALEPRRLAGRYLRDDLPFALRLLSGAVRTRLRSREK
ncbi:WecB/TagA/CpsF family glycosyltransferase [Saccharothrix algeriensis]|uniref:N-acetylglucosaminyldiphosphoundecaprenol N-acetyl-beta-D-mannosaminyltransferase n=1 Tax=Saccharothrix algeriensis TaxID=173560 RepID=A0A8T8I0E9_9PSEU|nr:WecB/TagA/CpsF family glycosyltransferase [Saccharothrix algeriensis]MBM7810188.1 N-acetylglucosaminyldiphosphoundecaprenol N-acetyl-beta-D-mannosaminyltransferase [Saccharothrix algeriensis]QTR04373.1 WecB/TagA/CpsF family glycosyltransferase [Saccharothrix algeriensis]